MSLARWAIITKNREDETMDEIKAKIEELVGKITKDAALKELFQKDPVQAVEKTLGVDIPDDAVEKIVAGVKAKLAGDKLAGAADALKGLLGGKK